MSHVLIFSETEQENLIKYKDENKLTELVHLKGREIVKAKEEKPFRRRDRRNQRGRAEFLNHNFHAHHILDPPSLKQSLIFITITT
jgi:hypothetical protein